MDYDKDIKTLLGNLSSEEREVLADRLGIDLNKPEQMLLSPHAFNEAEKLVNEELIV